MKENVKTTKAKKKNKNKKNKIFALICVLGALLLWLIFLVGYSAFVALSIFIPSIELPVNYTVAITTNVGTRDEKKEKYTVSKKDITIGGELYVNFTEIADRCEFPVSGDTTRLRYTISENESKNDYLTVFLSQNRAQLNGNYVNIPHGVKYIEGSLYLPLSFVDRYISGVEASFDEKEKTINISVGTMFFLMLQDNTAPEKVDISSIPEQE